MIDTLEVHVDAGTETAILSDHTATISGIDFSADGTLFASADTNSSVILRDAATLAEIQRFTGTGDVYFSPDGKLLAVGTTVFDLATGQEVLTTDDYYISDLTFSPDSSLLVTANSYNAQVRNASNGNELATLRGNMAYTENMGLTFSSDGKFLFTAGEDGVIRVWGVPAQ